MGHQVIVPLVIAKGDDGKDIYLYKGAEVPATVPEQEVARLATGGFIVDATPQVEVVVVIPEGDPAETWTVDQLKAFAAERSIELGEAKKKADILAVITAAIAA